MVRGAMPRSSVRGARPAPANSRDNDNGDDDHDDDDHDDHDDKGEQESVRLLQQQRDPPPVPALALPLAAALSSPPPGPSSSNVVAVKLPLDFSRPPGEDDCGDDDDSAARGKIMRACNTLSCGLFSQACLSIWYAPGPHLSLLPRIVSCSAAVPVSFVARG